jgi:hypothetical protein
MEHDRAIDHAGRLHDFLDRNLRQMTVIQPNQFIHDDMTNPDIQERYKRDFGRPKDDELITGLTGIGQLADRLISRIAAAKVRTESANTKVEQAFVKIDSAAVVLERVAEKAEAEADAAIARIGQVSNMEPE